MRVILGTYRYDRVRNASEDLHQESDVAELIVHDSYGVPKDKPNANVALLRLATPAICDRAHICTACLPEVDSQEPDAGDQCLISSWNTRVGPYTGEQQVLTERTMTLIDNSACQEHVNRRIDPDRYQVRDGQRCATETDETVKCQVGHFFILSFCTSL